VRRCFEKMSSGSLHKQLCGQTYEDTIKNDGNSELRGIDVGC
jgi:hypothetical protein